MLGWSLVFKVRGGLVRYHTIWTDNKEAAIREAMEWLVYKDFKNIELSEASQVEDGSFTKRF